ncbi:MAG: Cysteine desulfurase SufS [Fimbriimonadaceae bacterium]|nr:Cysteine desulfurase SufS [Fimbriimonadaceae bacterium]
MMPLAAHAVRETIRQQFPALDQEVNGKPLVYLDNAATTHRPKAVLAAMDEFYTRDNANVHRGVHALSQRATDRFEAAREEVRHFINASDPSEIIFTKGCTESINLVAGSYGASLKAGDIVLLSHMEHHANIVPWQVAAGRVGASVKPIPITDGGEIDLDAFGGMLTDRVKVVGVKHVCNAMGTVNPIARIIEMAHAVGAVVVVDGAQGLAHAAVDVQALDVDFYAMSAHKTYGPMGVGALYGKRALLEAMPPYQTGGSMIRKVTFEETTYAGLPDKFEPGTPNVAGVIGFGEALKWIRSLGIDVISAHEDRLRDAAHEALGQIPAVRLIGMARAKVPVISFTLDGIHPHDVGTVLDSEGVAVRTGHHCCMPLMERLGLPATTRASFSVYNTEGEVASLARAVKRAADLFR